MTGYDCVSLSAGGKSLDFSEETSKPSRRLRRKRGGLTRPLKDRCILPKIRARFSSVFIFPLPRLEESWCSGGRRAKHMVQFTSQKTQNSGSWSRNTAPATGLPSVRSPSVRLPLCVFSSALLLPDCFALATRGLKLVCGMVFSYDCRRWQCK